MGERSTSRRREQEAKDTLTPTEYGLLTELTSFTLQGNSLEGPIPTELAQLTDIDSYFNLASNKLTSSIPSQIGNMSVSSFFYLNENSLSGSIPTEIGAAPFYKSVYLDSNRLTGPLPTELGALGLITNNYAYFFLKSNSICGGRDTTHSDTSKYHYHHVYRVRPGL